NQLGVPLCIASALTALWAGAITLSTLLPEPLIKLMVATELVRNAAWVFLLIRMLGLRLQGTNHILTTDRWIPWYAVSVLVLLAIQLGTEPLTDAMALTYDLATYLLFGTWLAISIIGLLLLEQFFRNSNESELWSTKHLCIGLGILFAFDFFMYAEALMLRNLEANVWQVRGVVSAMAAILMVISTARTKRKESTEAPRRMYLSRHVAFHSLTLMASGIYLIAMSLAAYFISYLGGSWSGVLQIAFLCAAGLTLIVLLFSGRIRAHVRVWLSKNFFSYKYDYRIEWLEFTRLLASGEGDVPTNITRAVANLAKSPSGLLWGRSEEHRYALQAHWEMPAPGTEIDLGNLPAWLEEQEWIIDLREWRRSPDIYRNLALPPDLLGIARAWLIIPLIFGQKLQGILLLREPELPWDLNWEDRDLLKVASRQAASQLAQFQSDQALMESRQFEAFNRLSAYVIHDLKNILAQQSLMVANAQKHKHNPAFIDDMVDTVSNSVDRMSNLMVQLRSDAAPGSTATTYRKFELSELLQKVVADCCLRAPSPELENKDLIFPLHCDRERLRVVFGHLINNAQDATGKSGSVQVRLKASDIGALIEIEDTGVGMDEDFIRQRLFKPFDSTKGLTGMGIGAFESRDFIRSLGGDIKVQSIPGEGSLFRVSIPRETVTAT
ncbi:MAG: putative PEP-CTERM system histidine kinase, partial [Bacteroidia bacterium]